jgi:hypothetical protein
MLILEEKKIYSPSLKFSTTETRKEEQIKSRVGRRKEARIRNQQY